jgi:hypothetical protein
MMYNDRVHVYFNRRDRSPYLRRILPICTISNSFTSTCEYVHTFSSSFSSAAGAASAAAAPPEVAAGAEPEETAPPEGTEESLADPAAIN